MTTQHRTTGATTNARHLVLVGLMATGKSTVGRRVAHELGRPLLDSDATVEDREGRTVRDIWRSDGEAAFRALETDVLRDALAAETPSVLAAAGGVVLSETNRQLLSDPAVAVVWLRAEVATLVARVVSSTAGHRPLLDENPVARLSEMATDRAEHYAAVADHIVDVDDRSIDEVASDVATWFRSVYAPSSEVDS